jgi:aspartate/methionine/tyrosine aminotransferase
MHVHRHERAKTSTIAGNTSSRRCREGGSVPSATVTTRTDRVPAFHAMAMSRAASELEAAGRAIVHLEVGQPATGASQRALDAVRAALDTPLGYTNAPGLPALRRRIARHYADTHGLEVDPERILAVAGASAGFTLAFVAAFDPGARVAVVEPGYPCYRNTLLALDLTPVPVPVGPETRWAPTPELLDAAVTAGGPLDGVVIASPSNPTGTVLDAATLAALVAWCDRHGAHLIADEIYHGITYGERAASALEVEPDAIVVNSFSKLYRMPGWRLGWLVVPERLIEPFRAHLINLFLTPTSVSQHAALAAMDAGDDIAAAVAGYAANRARLLEALPRIGLPRLCVPDGAFYIYADVADYTDDSLAFCRRLLADTGVAITPGIDFDTVHGGSHVRFSFAGSLDDVGRALARLAPWLAAQPRRTGVACDEPVARAGAGFDAG